MVSLTVHSESRSRVKSSDQALRAKSAQVEVHSAAYADARGSVGPARRNRDRKEAARPQLLGGSGMRRDSAFSGSDIFSEYC